MGIFKASPLSGLVSLIRDQYPSVQASSPFGFVNRAWAANETMCSLTVPRSGVWQVQFDGYQAGTVVSPNMQIQHNGVAVFAPSMVFGGITNNQWIQVQANAGDTISVAVITADPTAVYVCDIVAIQTA